MKNEFTDLINEQNKPVPQTEKAHDLQKQNNAGGFSFTVSDGDRLMRFLILGTSGGTFYVSEQDLTKQNVQWLIEMIQQKPGLVLEGMRLVSVEGRALRQSPTIFTMAMLFEYGSTETKAAARAVFNEVIRTSTHLFEFMEYVTKLGAHGLSRARKSAVQRWYQNKSADQLAYQAVKYRQRNGWTHRDVFRMARPTGVEPIVGSFILGKDENHTLLRTPRVIQGFEHAQQAGSLTDVLSVLQEYPNLPWESIPTQFLREPELWKMLFNNGQLQGQALVRNVTRLARIGAFKDLVFARDYATKLTDEEMIQQTRLHPFNYLNALIVHTEGQINRNSANWYMAYRTKDWDTVPIIRDALNTGFYSAFKYVEPANKRTFIGLDVSGSMSSAASGVDLTCAQAGAAIAMTVAKTEPYYTVYGFASELRDLGISPNDSLDTTLNKTQRHTFGATDCSLPMTFAAQEKLEIDTFIVLTDSETWAGRVHPYESLDQYRQQTGIPAKLIVVGMTATPFTIANPEDPGMVDVVGMDAAVPKFIAEFSKD